MDADPPAEVRVLSGFSLAWDKRPHRIKVLAVEVGSAEPQVDIQGGSWADGTRGSDTARVELGIGTLTGRAGHVGTTTLTLTGHGDGPAAGDAVIEVPLDQPAAGVFLTGFRFAVGADHQDGYTVHAVSVVLGDPVVVDGVARVPLHAELDAGRVPDRVQRIGSYGSVATVSWAVVGCAPGGATHAAASGFVRRWAVPWGASADAVRVSLPISGATGALVGLSGFAFDVRDGPLDGRYTRHLQIWAEPPEPSYVPVRLGFDNAGFLARPLNVELGAELSVLWPVAGEAVETSSWSTPAR